LLPYIYTSMEESSRTGVPLMRAMFMEFPQDRELTTNDSQFMFGDALLVVPKVSERLDPVEAKLPEGTWYDFWTGETVKGGTSLSLKPALDAVPVYVRAGAIIPRQSTIQYVGEVPAGPLQVHGYPGPNCRGTVYADDGNTFGYQRGAFHRTTFTCEMMAGALSMKISAPEGSYRPWWKEVEVTMHGADAAPRRVEVGGRETSDWRFDADTRSVAIRVPAGSAAEIVVRY